MKPEKNVSYAILVILLKGDGDFRLILEGWGFHLRLIFDMYHIKINMLI